MLADPSSSNSFLRMTSPIPPKKSIIDIKIEIYTCNRRETWKGALMTERPKEHVSDLAYQLLLTKDSPIRQPATMAANLEAALDEVDRDFENEQGPLLDRPTSSRLDRPLTDDEERALLPWHRRPSPLYLLVRSLAFN